MITLTVTYQQWVWLSHSRRHHDDHDDDTEAEEEEYEDDEEDKLDDSFNQCTSHSFIKTITDRNT